MEYGLLKATVGAPVNYFFLIDGHTMDYRDGYTMDHQDVTGRKKSQTTKTGKYT